jgi:thiamine-phosphate pyrophosphorylase
LLVAVDFRLYLITDREQTRMPLPEAVRQALDGGVRAVQLREKDLPVRELLALARDLRTLTGEYGAKLFINDRVDVAVAVGADGVHLGQRSMPASAVRKIVGTTMLIGVSTHSAGEARAAQAEGADFITFGPVFETPSKAPYGPPLGPIAIREVKNEVALPVFAIGGIRSGNLLPVLSAGADGVAMISAILSAEDIPRAAAAFDKGIATIKKVVCTDFCAPR